MFTNEQFSPNALAAIDLDSSKHATFYTGHNLVVLPQIVNSHATPPTTSTSSLAVPTDSLSPVSGATGRSTITSTLPPPTATAAESDNSTPVIIGSTVGGVFGILLLLVVILVLRYRRRIQVGITRKLSDSHHRHRQTFGITPLPISALHVPPSSSRSPDDHVEPGRGDLEVMERAVQGLRSQVGVMAQRVAQLESELVEQGPPDYTSNSSHPPETESFYGRQVEILDAVRHK
ncbi:hypothetical protein PQX77_002269 [Marasmius sp. AFHP31]|nr:hypothetical protein PQX77_002269 [Marasmius sp. AFHP31]